MNALRIAQHVGLLKYDGETESALFMRRLILMGIEIGVLWLLIILIVVTTRFAVRCP